MRDLTVLGGAVLLAGLVLGLTIGFSVQAARDRERVTVVFSPGTSRAEMLVVVARAEGRIARETVLPFGVEVVGERPGIARRLDGTGAWLVLATLPVAALMVGGCSYLDPAACEAGRAGLAAGTL